jgi:hypothetical protein
MKHVFPHRRDALSVVAVEQLEHVPLGRCDFEGETFVTLSMGNRTNKSPMSRKSNSSLKICFTSAVALTLIGRWCFEGMHVLRSAK